MSRPNWITSNVVAALQGIVAQLEAIAAAYQVDASAAASFTCPVAVAGAPSASTSATTVSVQGLIPAMAALYNALPLLVSPDDGVDPSVTAGLIAIARGLGQAMDPNDAVAAFASAVDATADAPPAPTSTDNRLADSANAEAVSRLARMVYIAPYAEALTSASFASRSAAITARADCSERFERQLELSGGASDIGVTGALIAMRDAAIAYLTQAIINAVPVLQVSSPSPLPSLFWAWRLYQDPTRIVDLVARNGAPTSEFMPNPFEALAA